MQLNESLKNFVNLLCCLYHILKVARVLSLDIQKKKIRRIGVFLYVVREVNLRFVFSENQKVNFKTKRIEQQRFLKREQLIAFLSLTLFAVRKRGLVSHFLIVPGVNLPKHP